MVAKVGGSLLDLPDLADRVGNALSSYTDHLILLIVGGGAAVEDLRRRSSSGELAIEAAHWGAIAEMGRNSARLSQRITGAQIVDRLEACSNLSAGLVIVDPMHDLDADAGRTLPIGWHVTSDSIAAWCALRLGAIRLTMFKSVGATRPIDVRDAVNSGWLDDYFPTLFAELAARGCAIDWINLRNDPPSRCELVGL